MSEPVPAAAASAIEEPDIEGEVEQAISLCGGDAVAALRVTLIANAFLTGEVERLTEQISSGLHRGRLRKAPKKKGA
jgi:hypothetical protein